MLILQINYGPQSGVTQAIRQRLVAAGHQVETFDPVASFMWKTRLVGRQVPRVLPEQSIAVAVAVRRFGRNWKVFYTFTCFAFDRLTARCQEAIVRLRPDAVLQSGVLFSPGDMSVPSYLYCDHTRAIAENYPPLPRAVPPIPFEQAWRDKETRTYQAARHVFTMSEYVRRSLIETYGVSPSNVTVVGAGPNIVPGPGQLGPAPQPVFLFVGVDFDRKGGYELMEAFGSVRARHPAAELWMVGLHQPDSAPEGVRLLGPKHGTDLQDLFHRASAFVLPPVQEPFGLAFLEAMSFGLPCIGTGIEAIPEVIEDGVTGIVVAPRSPAELAAAMNRLLANPAAAHAMGERGRSRVQQRFGWDRAVRLMLEHIEHPAGPASASSDAARGIG